MRHAEMVIMLLALAVFGLLHSLTAAQSFKRAVRARLGERVTLGLYRLLYNAVSAVTFFPILVLLAVNPGPVIWSVDGVVAALLAGLRMVALVGLVAAGLQIDLLRFAGLRQAWAWLRGDPLPLPPERFIQSGMYGLVRHPLYLSVMLYLWATPQMNAASLGFALGSSVYFVTGAWLEECRMVRELGDEYTTYQQRVAWMIPFVHLPTPRCTPEDAISPGQRSH